ncbi:MAG TPA: hypothetical protein VFY70_02070, partial [Thermomicrobiales bacterium]|nr:hypothetical protein [Thermomicrobiales bacterium]
MRRPVGQISRRHVGAPQASPGVRRPITHHLSPITLVILFCATLLLSGCATGSPSIVAPVAPETSSQNIIPPAEPAEESSAPESEAGAIVAPETAAPSAEIQPAAIDTTTQVGSVAAESLDPSAPEV